MRTYPPRLRRDLGVVPRGNSRGVWLHEPLPINSQPVGLGFPHREGRYRPGGSAFSSPRCWSRRDMEGFLTRGWERILPGCGGTSALAQGATFDPRWLQEPQRISNHPTGLGFPHPTGRYRPGVSTFSSPDCWSCRDMEGFMTRGWKRILPGCGGTSTLAREATLAASWLHEHQTISNQPCGLVSTPCGAVSTRGICFYFPGLLEL